MSLIAVPFSDKVSLLAIARAKKEGMGVAELRVDLFSSYQTSHVLNEARKFKKIKTIATIRSQKEGGAWKGTEVQRLELFKALFPHVSIIDIELSSQKIIKPVIAEAHRLRKTAIVSYHHFQKTPNAAALETLFKKAKKAGADIVKIAAMARSKKDVRTLAQFTAKHARQGVITLSMGKEGEISRILFPSLGSLLTFAHAGRSTAPGQMDLKTTARLLKKFHA